MPVAAAQVHIDVVDQLSDAWESLVDGVLEALPGIAVALIAFAVFWAVGRLVRRSLRRRWTRTRSESYGRVFSTLAFWGVLAVGLIVAVPLAFPSVNALSMLGGLGLLGIAAGFAFQDILSNLLAGILLLVRQPFEAGDQITVNGIQGTVQLITIRETRLKTFGGRVVYVPNQDVYTNAIEVQTGEPTVRTSLVVGVDYDTDLPHARQVALDVLADVEGVEADPAPQAYYTEFGASAINLDLRYWTGSRQADIRRVQDRVVERVKAAFDEAGVDIPFDIVTLDTRASFERTIARSRASGSGEGNGSARAHIRNTP